MDIIYRINGGALTLLTNQTSPTNISGSQGDSVEVWLSEKKTGTVLAAGSTPTFNAMGTANGGFAGATPVLPTHANGDLLCVLYMCRFNDTLPAAPSGWAFLSGSGVISGSVAEDPQIGIYTKTATSSSESNPAFGDAGARNYAVAFVIGGASSISVLSTTSSSGSSVSVSGGTTSGDNRLIVVIVGNGIADQTTDQMSSEANSSLTSFTKEGWVQALDNYADRGADIYSGEKATSGSVTATTGTQAATSAYAGLVLEIA